jgi:general secretion pathway protein G
VLQFSYMKKLTNKLKSGFTLIELLVVISIIGLLSSVVLTSLRSSRARAVDSKRIQTLKQLQTALELYRSVNNAYPIASDGLGNCTTSGLAAIGIITTKYDNNSSWIPNLSPKYIATIPDPANASFMTIPTTECYIYKSTENGSDYKLSLFKGYQVSCPNSSSKGFSCATSGEHIWKPSIGGGASFYENTGVIFSKDGASIYVE